VSCQRVLLTPSRLDHAQPSFTSRERNGLVLTQMPRVLVIASTIAVLAACDPAYQLRLRQPLHPVPASSCLERALQHSPHVLHVVPLESTGSLFRVTLTDSSRTGPIEATMALGDRPDSAGVVSMRYVRMATARTLSPSERQRRIRLATDLLDEVRLACAPGTPRAITCDGSLGRPTPCPAA